MKERALKIANDLYTQHIPVDEIAFTIRRLVEELDKVPEVVFDEGVYRWNLPNGDEFVIVPQAQKRLSNHDLQKMWKGSVESCGWDSVIDFARAIEERHGIK